MNNYREIILSKDFPNGKHLSDSMIPIPLGKEAVSISYDFKESNQDYFRVILQKSNGGSKSIVILNETQNSGLQTKLIELFIDRNKTIADFIYFSIEGLITEKDEDNISIFLSFDPYNPM